jgi:hypothetical protein
VLTPPFIKARIFIQDTNNFAERIDLSAIGESLDGSKSKMWILHDSRIPGKLETLTCKSSMVQDGYNCKTYACGMK